jgi:hypothetical protein
MAHATIQGKRFEVRVIQDLTDNWSLEVFPPPAPKALKASEPFKNWPVPLCLKIRADSREDALLHGLTHMKKLGKIDEFHLDPAEMPKEAPPKAKVEETEEAAEE